LPTFAGPEAPCAATDPLPPAGRFARRLPGLWLSWMNQPTAPEKLIFWKEKIGYAVGDTASCLFWQTFSMFLMIFYTDTFGITPAAVGLMLLISRFIDAAADPVMGVIADRTETRHGKFRPWLLWGLVPFGVAGVLVFITPDLNYTGKLIYAYLTYNFMMFMYTMVNVPYGALLGVISPNSKERTALASYRFIGAFAGNIIVQGTLLYMVKEFGHGNNRVGYPLAVGVFAVLAGLLFFTTFYFTKERVKPPAEQSSVANDLKDLVRNRPWVVLCLMGLATLIYVSIRNAATLYFFKYYIGDEAAGAPFMVIGTVFSIVGAILAPYIARLFPSKKATFVGLTIICGLTMVLFYFGKKGDLPLLYGCHIVMSVFNAAMFPLIWSMYADTADYGEWRFGRRATGLVFSAATFAQKMGWAVGGGLAGFLLSFVGFVANEQQTASSLNGIRNMMSLIPASVTIIAVVIGLFYNLTTKLELQIRDELIARRGIVK
jgi:glycoside/pentoside/hexuronide:cation symporter, GPH family